MASCFTVGIFYVPGSVALSPSVFQQKDIPVPVPFLFLFGETTSEWSLQ
jgi:hypothetical protein